MDDLLPAAAREALLSADSRLSLWVGFLNDIHAEVVAEIGVHRGDFAAALLAQCPSIRRYYLIDPWRHLSDWNKPCNTTDERQAEHYARAVAQTAPYADRVCFLRGTTLEVIQSIPNASLDFCYIDGDHTLRGITIDLLCAAPKVRADGWIGGDDFNASVWQHGPQFEPTLVYPYAVHFAEAMCLRIAALPHGQFLLRVSPRDRFEFADYVGVYGDVSLKRQCAPPRAPGAQAEL